MAENNKPSNLTLIVEGEALHVQKCILAKSSSYFRAMFSIDMMESTADMVEIREVSANVLKQLVRFAYTGELALSVDDAIDLIGGASMLQFTEVVQLCHDRMLSGIDPNNCLCIMHLADGNGFNQLFNKAKVYALWYFENVINSNDFLGLPYNLLVDYLSSETINVTSEFTVFTALTRWIGHAECDREEHFPALFEHIHTTALSDSELRLVLKSDVINKFPECRDTVEGLLAPSIFQSTASGIECRGQNDQYPKRKRRKSEKSITACRKVPRAIWSIGGDFMNDKERWANQDVLEFNMDSMEFDKISQLPMFSDGIAWGYKACSVGKDLYILGGEIKQGMRPTWSEAVWKFDTFEQNWSVAGALDQPRRHHSLVVHQMYIYVVGGFGKHRIMLNTASRFHTITGEWERLPDLPSAVYSAALCVCNHHLYCIKTLVHYLTPGATAWTAIGQSLPCDMGVQTALPSGDKIYLLGSHVKRLVEFDTVTQIYTDLGSFQNAMGQGCLLQEKIHVFCGEDGENIETYDLCTKEFCVVKKLDHCMYNHSVVVMPKYPRFR